MAQRPLAEESEGTMRGSEGLREVLKGSEGLREVLKGSKGLRGSNGCYASLHASRARSEGLIVNC